MIDDGVIIVRGAGDIATGTICRLHHCGFRLLVLETSTPTAIRRSVALSDAVYEGQKTVEGVTSNLIKGLGECESIWAQNRVPLVVDPNLACLEEIRPMALIDAILAKKNCGTQRDMAAITIGLGPGFTAGTDVHAVIETARGHQLGRTIYRGSPLTDSGIPGTISGHNKERVIYAPVGGILEVIQDIGSRVRQGEPIARIGQVEINAPLTGCVRGMIRHKTEVSRGLKIADIDPRGDEVDNCFTISDKARCISGGVLEALLFLNRNQAG